MDVRIKFNKTNEVAFISHLDLLRTFNRMLMRSGLKPSYSQGYNPHIILAFAQPSSVGMVTKNDCADISFAEVYSLDEIKEKLINAAPAGIEIISVTEEKDPQFNKIAKAGYTLYLVSNQPLDRLKEFFEKEEILIDKKTKKGIKEVDIKPLIYSYEVKKAEDAVVLELVLASGSNSNLNPSLIIKAMEKYIDGFLYEDLKVTREALFAENGKVY